MISGRTGYIACDENDGIFVSLEDVPGDINIKKGDVIFSANVPTIESYSIEGQKVVFIRKDEILGVLR